MSALDRLKQIRGTVSIPKANKSADSSNTGTPSVGFAAVNEYYTNKQAETEKILMPIIKEREAEAREQQRLYDRYSSIDLPSQRQKLDNLYEQEAYAKLNDIGSKFVGYGGYNPDFDEIMAAGERGRATLANLPDLDEMEKEYAAAKQYQDASRYSNLLNDPSFMSSAKQGAGMTGNLADAQRNYASNLQESIGSGYLRGLNRETPRTAEGFNALLDPSNEDSYFNFALRTAVGGAHTDQQKQVDLIQNMTQEEIDLYHALLAREGEDSANAFLDYMAETINQRGGSKVAEWLDDKPLREIGYSIPAGFDQWYSGTKQTFSKDTQPTSVTQYASQQVRENLGDTGFKLPEWMGGSSIGQTLYDIGSTTANMAPSIMAGALLGGAGAPAVLAQGIGAATMGASVYGNSYQQALKEGFTKRQASNYAALTSLAEGSLQYLLGGISAVGGVVTKNIASKAMQNIGSAIGRIATSLPISMLGEGVEEYLQEVLDPVFRNLAFDENNEVKLFTPEAAYSGILGALTAGFLEGPVNISNNIKVAQYGKMVIESNHTDALVQSALTMPEGSAARELAQRISDGEVNPGNANVGELVTKYAEEGGDTSFLSIPVEEAPTVQKTAPAAPVSEETAQATPRQTAPENIAPAVPEGAVAATRNDTRQEVGISGIESVENGTVFVELSDGSVAPLSDVTLEDPDLEEVYETAGLFDTQTAKAFIAAYDGSVDAKTLYSGFTALYGAARKGIPFQQAVQQNQLAVEDLPDSVQAAAYAAGKGIAPAKVPVSATYRTETEVSAKIPEAQQAAPVERTAAPVENKKAATSKVTVGVVHDHKTQLSKTQRRHVKALDAFAKAIGRKFVVQDNIYASNGKAAANVTSAESKGLKGVNAYFDPSDNTYYISLDSVGQALMFYAMHENVHDIAKNNLEGYTNLQKIVFDVLGEESVSRAREIQRGLYPDESEAYIDEEIVANTVPAILSDPKTYEELARRVARSNSKTRQAFEALLKRLEQTFKRAYQVLKGEKSWEQLKQLEQDMESIKRIRAAYLDALEGMQNAETAMSPSNEVKFSRKYDAKYAEKAVRINAENGKPVPDEVLAKANEQRAEIAVYMSEHEKELALPEDIEGNTAIGNAAYGYSQENSTVCIRSLMADEFVDAIGEKLGRPLTEEEAIYASQEAAAFVKNPQCIYCYVAMDRNAFRAFLGKYLEQRDDVISKLGDPSADSALYEEFRGKRKDTKDMRARFDLWVDSIRNLSEMITPADLASDAAMKRAIERNPALEEQINDAKKYAQAASWAKKRIPYKAYNNGILSWKDSRVKQLNRMFGMRMYSFSDYSPAFLLENMQMFTDAAVKKLKVLAYTKDINFARIFAPTGANINLSVFGYETGGKVAEDNMQGASWAEARKVRDQYSNVGITFVATNDNLVNWALEQDWIDVVIPFHLVHTGKLVADMLDYIDYKSESSDKKTDAWVKGNAKEIYPTVHQNNREKYFAALKANNLSPRFERFVDNPNYMKLVNETRRPSNETPAVQPKFDMKYAYESLQELIDDGGYVQHVGGNIETMQKLAARTAKRITEGGVEKFKQERSALKLSAKDPATIDREYMAAVESGDMETAQRMVDEAAKRWGAFLNNDDANEVFPQSGEVRRFYHGTNTGEFTRFDKSLLGNSSGDLGWFGKGFYFAFSAGEAATYGRRVINAYLKMRNPYDYSQLYRFKGSDYSGKYSRFAWLYNIVNHFPDIVKGQKVYAYPDNAENGSVVSWEQLAGWMDRIEREKEFSVVQVETSYGDTAWELRADPKKESFTNEDGETFTWTEYGMRQLFATEREAKEPINQIGAYLSNVMGVETIPRRSIETIDFSMAVQRAGYDGIVQSPSGDEAVVFESNQIKSADPVTYDDNGKVIPLSERFNTENPDIRFSLKDTSAADVNTLKAQNKKLTEALEVAKAQTKLTKGTHVKPSAIKTYANRILRETKSSYDAETLIENLTKIYDYLGNATDPDMDLIEREGIAMTKAVLEKSSELDNTIPEMYSDAIEYLKTTPISLNETQRKEAAHSMDSYGNYRRALMGNTKLTKDGLNLDIAWQELSEMHPDLFPADTTSADMPGMLYAAVQAMKPTYRNPYGYDIDGAAADLFLDMFMAYADMPLAQTFADRKAAEKQAAVAKQKGKTEAAKAETKAVKQDMAQRHDILSGMHKQEMANLRKELNAKIIETRREARKAHAAAMREAEQIQKAWREQDRQILAGMHKVEMRNAVAETIAKERAAFAEWKRADREKRNTNATVKKYRDRITANVKTLTKWLLQPTDTHHVPEVLRRTVNDFVQSISFESEKAPKASLLWRERLQAVKDTMARIERGDGEFTDFYAEIDPDLVPRLEAFIGSNRDVQTVADLDADQLRELDFLTNIVKRTVVEANKMLTNARYQTVAQTGNASIMQLNQLRARKPKGKVGEMVDNLLNVDQLDSFSYFDRLGDAAYSVFQSLRDGFDKKIINTRQAMEYMDGVLKGKNLKTWSGSKAEIHHFKVSGGELDLTTAQIMELYLLNQREQARGHIYGEGIKPAEQTGKVGKKTKQTIAHAPVKVTEANVSEILSVLTNEQRAVADAVQKFMENEVAHWGNEVSLELYGYKKFTEEHYYPIKSDQNYTLTQDPSANSGLYALRNLGATKATVQGANNAIIIGDIFDTFTKHVDEMASYNAFTVPLSDAMKWFNYKDRDGGTGSVKQAIERVVGKKGQQYFVNFVKDLNGVSTGSYTIGLADGLFRNAKVAAVGANLRVVVQQPTAYVRAAAMISPKYLSKAIFKKSNAAKAKKYSAIAQWKDWGFFDMDTGRSMRELIVGNQEFASKVREKSLALAGKMDDFTWGKLWNACELEIKATRKDLKVGSEEFNQAVGKRLSDIVDRTQVVDSVFHRAQLMRSKDKLTQIYTSFMSEPTKSYNMLRTALADVYQNPKSAEAKRKLARVATSYVAAGVATAIASSIVDAFRDDDDEKNWLEKYWAALKGGIADNVNVLNTIPVVKDILSLMQGYSASRMDLQAFERLVNLGGEIFKLAKGESKWSVFKFIKEGSNALSSVTGIPVGNAVRAFQSIYNTFADESLPMVSNLSSASGTYDVVYKAFTDGNADRGQKLLDRLYADKVNELVKEEEKRAKAGEMAQFADRASLEASARNSIERGMADVLMDDPRIAEAYELREKGMITELKAIYKEIQALGFKQDMVTRAINSYANNMAKAPSEVTDDDLKMYTTDTLFAAVERGDSADIDAAFKELVKYSTANDPEDAITKSVKTEFKKRYLEQIDVGNLTKANQLADYVLDNFDLVESADIQNWVIEAYQESFFENESSNITKALENTLRNEYGVQQWRMEELQTGAVDVGLVKQLRTRFPEYEDYINTDSARPFVEYAEPAGVTPSVAFGFMAKQKKFKTIKDNNGKEIKSRQEQVWELIDSMDLTNAQKDALHCMEYQPSTLKNTPWH